MRILYPTSQVRPYYDRNPTQVVLQWGGNVSAPDAGTLRASYEVPSGRVAILEYAFGFAGYGSGGSANDWSDIWLYLTTSVGSGQIMYAYAKNASGQFIMVQNANIGIWLLGGSILDLYTSGIGTGTFTKRLTAKLVEFDR
jgi:hypothetical protein